MTDHASLHGPAGDDGVMEAHADVLTTERLVLEPLRVEHAAAMVDVLADPALYQYTGGAAPTLAELRTRYERQTSGNPAWRNWVVVADDIPIGYVQATLADDEAALAWVIGSRWQGRGYATEAARVVMEALSPRSFSALIAPGNLPSQHVATSLGLRPTDEVIDAETRWKA